MGLYWFLLGASEFRRCTTTNPGEFIGHYDCGRELAHWLTFRRFEQ